MRRDAGITLTVLLATAGVFAADADLRLLEAARANDHAAAMALVARKIDVNAADPDGTTALHYAIHNDDVELARRLIRAGADVKARNQYGATPLSEAAVLGSTAMLVDLVEGGAD